MFEVLRFEMWKINSLSNSIIVSSGASGPSTTLKQFSKRSCALSSAFLTSSTDSNGPPLVALAHTTPTVISFIAPGSSVKGPAD